MEFKTDNISAVGNKGQGVRSDCHVTLELTDSGGLKIELISKVESMYGMSIRSLVKEVLNFLGIENAKLLIEDSGALPLVLAARLEAAVKLLKKVEKEYLFPMIPENNFSTARDLIRFSRLYLPGNTPSLAINSGVHKPDAIILDLEDAVAPAKKFEACFLVRNSLRSIDFYGAERMVRINQLPQGLDDLEFIVPHNVNVIILPKCESADQVTILNERISIIKSRSGSTQPVWIMPIIESAMGVFKALEIAQGENVVAMAIGLEDYTADIGTKRTAEGMESLFARSVVVNACKAMGIQANDSVYSDVSDMEGLKQYILKSKAMGFDGMGCIHPRQIPVIHEFYAPDEDEINEAKKIVKASAIAIEKGLGVVSLGTKMIDAPVVKRAQNLIDYAVALGKLDSGWLGEPHV